MPCRSIYDSDPEETFYVLHKFSHSRSEFMERYLFFHFTGNAQVSGVVENAAILQLVNQVHQLIDGSSFD